MYVHDLVSLFNPAVLASIEAIPVAQCRFIDVAIRATAGIQRYLVRATCVTDERRTVTRSGPSGWINAYRPAYSSPPYGHGKPGIKP